MECAALALLKDGDRIAGVAAYWRETGRFVLFRCKAVILATGGGGKAWRVTSNSWEYTGDGIHMAFNAGAELMDIEFTQFHPTGMVWPPSVRGTLVTEGVRGEGGILTNSEGERFMFRYVPDRFASETADSEEEALAWLNGGPNKRRPPELLTRDVVARAILAEVKAGRGSPKGGAFLDIATRREAAFIRRKLPSMYHQFKELAEVDITAEPMQVGPTLHYFMGGVRVDADSQMTNVSGLFACGEAAAGLHGANRLGGNSLSDLIVFGRLAGVGAKAYIEQLAATPTADDEQIVSAYREATDILNREDGPNPYMLHDQLQELMQENVGIIRTAEQLQTGIEQLGALKEQVAKVKAHGSSQYNPGWHEALSMQSLVMMSEAIARAALMREESRGAHTRLDFEGERDEWLKYNIIVSKGDDGEIVVTKVERPEAPADLKAIAHASIEDLESGKVGQGV
jgi:succinate dehydrogenase / fumarate reductase, flavoprotein subunit